MRDIGKNIRQLRNAKNMTQDELAERLFVTRQTVSNYETGKSRPDVEMLVKISEILETDIHQVIYGPEPLKLTKDMKRLIAGAAITLVLLIALEILTPIVKAYQGRTLLAGWTYLLQGAVRPLAWLTGGWTLAHLLGMALKKKPLEYPWVKYAQRSLMTVLILWIAIAAGYAILLGVFDWLYVKRIWGVWEETTYEVNGVVGTTVGWSNLPLPIPQWLKNLAGTLLVWSVKYRHFLLLFGGALWLLDFPRAKQTD